MMNSHKVALTIKLALISLFLVLTGCGGGGGGGVVTLLSIAITPATVDVPLGTTVQLNVTGMYSDNTTSPIASTQVAFVSSSPSVATVDVDGTVVGLTEGSSATITATLLTKQATAAVNVVAPALVGLEISPTTVSLPEGGLTAQFTAKGRLSDGSDEDYTTRVTWGSDQPGFATIAAATGLATTVANGAATITAVNGDVEGSASLEVTNPTLDSVVISPSTPTLGLGTTQQLTATAFYGDGSEYDVTELATWSPTAGANVSVNNTAGSKGIITGVTIGLSDTISALFDTETGSTIATVSSAVLSSIEVQPANRNISSGSQLAFTAIGHYNDGTIQDLTDQVAWSSSLTGIATIVPATGLATAVSAGGPTTITAQEGFTGGNIPGTTELTVKNNTLKGINVISPEATLAVGTQTTLTAIGNYSDGDTQDLSGQVTWVSTDSTILTVNASGRVTAVGVGAARISALSSSASGSLIGSVGITVSNDALLSIAIETPDPTSMASGTKQALKVTGNFGTHFQDMTDQVVWSWTSVDSGVVSISNDLGTAGELTAVTSGTVDVTASYPGVAAATTPTITINAGSITSLTISLTPASVNIGEVRQLTAIATYNAGADPQDVTEQVAWSSGNAGDNGVVSVSNLKGSKGQVRGISAGNPATIFGNFDGQPHSITVNVTNVLTDPVSLTVEAAPNVIINDGLDDTELTVNVLAAASGSTVPNGTTVTLTKVSGPGALSTPSTATTIDGVATGVTFTSDTTGLTVIEASVPGTNGPITNTVAIDVTDDFRDLIGKTATFAGNDDGAGNLEIGAFFGLFATNLSNRDFNVGAFVFTDSNGDTTGTADPAQLSGGILEAGEQMGFVIQTDDVFPLGVFRADYFFSDADTSEIFDIGAEYNLTPVP